ncbi:MAG: T9SS type A sorting domain-containing protein [Paludibacter sp.]
MEGLTGTSNVKLYDMVGKVLQFNVVSASTLTLNVPVAGMYLLEVNKKTMKMVVK